MQYKKATFHLGADYACVLLEGQTTDTALVQLYGTSEQISHYGKLIEIAINTEFNKRELKSTYRKIPFSDKRT